MKSKVISKTGNKLKIEMEIELDPTSMLNSEDQIAKALNDAGLLATGEALELFDANGSPIELKGRVMTSKGKQKKTTKVPTVPKK